MGASDQKYEQALSGTLKRKTRRTLENRMTNIQAKNNERGGAPIWGGGNLIALRRDLFLKTT